jgi:hypothetical protein
MTYEIQGVGNDAYIKNIPNKLHTIPWRIWHFVYDRLEAGIFAEYFGFISIRLRKGHYRLGKMLNIGQINSAKYPNDIYRGELRHMLKSMDYGGLESAFPPLSMISECVELNKSMISMESTVNSSPVSSDNNDKTK